MHSSARKMRQRESPRNRENGLRMNQNGREEDKTLEETTPSKDQTEQRSKLRNRDSIAKPETLQYEPNLNKGLHARIMHSILKEASSKSKNDKKSNSNLTTNKRKSESPTKDKQNSIKKAKGDANNGQTEYFDSYAFSMQLINTEDEKIQAQKGKSPSEKNILCIGNLPYDVTREQLEEHFRKTGGIKAIRIPRDRGSDKGRGFAYMEFDGRISLGIALRLHQTTLGGNTIDVDFTQPVGGKQVKQK